jgi:hypothetical protein
MEGQFDPNLYCTGQLCHWQAHEVSGFLVSNLGKNHHCQFCESLYIRSTPYVLGVIETIRERALSANLPATLHARYHADNYAAFRDVSRSLFCPYGLMQIYLVNILGVFHLENGILLSSYPLLNLHAYIASGDARCLCIARRKARCVC